MTKKLYQFECTRSNVTPRGFFTTCRREFLKRTGHDLSEWVDSFETWANPTATNNTRTIEEICCIQPLFMQLFERRGYNFILEFDPYDDRAGAGYCYIVEFER